MNTKPPDWQKIATPSPDQTEHFLAESTAETAQHLADSLANLLRMAVAMELEKRIGGDAEEWHKKLKGAAK